jgi:hypothetical protein
MVELLVSVVNLTSTWIYFSIVLTVTMLVLWRFMIVDFGASPALFVKFLTFAFFLIVFGLDKLVFFLAVKNQPRLDFGVIIAVIGSLILFWYNAVLFVPQVYRAVRRGWFSVEAVSAYLPALRTFNRMQVAFALAHSSIGGLLLAFLNTVFVRVQERLIPPDPRKSKSKSRRPRYKDE